MSLVKELPGAAKDIANVGGMLFITLVDDKHLDSGVSEDLRATRTLWRSDGTTAGTIQLKSFAQRSFQFVNVNNKVFFAADDGISGLELWKSDGTAVGTALVKDINPGPMGSNVRSLANGNGTLFFMADGASADSQGLWKSDGTVSGTILFKESSAFVYPALDSLTNVNGTLFFVAEGALWTTDGTNYGTYSLNDNRRFLVLPGSLTNLNGTLFFFVQYRGTELWKSDGTVDGTVAVTGVNLPAYISITSMTTSNGRWYFTAY